MINIIFETISHIPWYVYLILYVLVKRGVSALKDQQVPLAKLFIFPVAMTVWAFYDIQMMFGLMHLEIILSIVIGLILGIIPGIHLVKNRVSYKDKMLILHGSWFTLILVLSVFIFKCVTFSFIGYNPTLIKSIQFAIMCAFGFSFVAGITIGRLSYFLYIFKLNYLR